MPIKLPSGKYRVQIRIKGHPRVDQVFDTKKEAAAFEDSERERIESKAPLYTLAMTFREAWHAYHVSLLFQRKKPTTRRTEESRIVRALKSLGDYSLAQLVDGQVISRFRDQLGMQRVKVMVRQQGDDASTKPKSKGGRSHKVEKPLLVPGHRRDGNEDGTLSNDGQRLVLAAVSSVMLWVVEQGLMVRNPMRGIAKPKPGERERRMDRDEELNVFLLAKTTKGADQRLHEDARFLAIQRELGCRPGELAELLRADIDLDAFAVRFRNAKNGDTRIVHMVEEAGQILAIQMVQAEVQHPDSPFVFTSRSRAEGKPVRFNYSGAVVRLRDAGVVDHDFHAHAARREFASGAFEAGLPVEDIRKQTGHRSIKALEAYNKSDGMHPDSRRRVEEAGRRRAAERFEDLASALGVSPDKLIEFQRANTPDPLQPKPAKSVGDAVKPKVRHPFRRPVSPIRAEGKVRRGSQ